MSSSEKLDLLKLHRAEYVAPRKPVLITVKPAQYLAIRGRGRPGGEEFAQQVGALYSVAFTTKMQRKFAGRGDYTIGKLEARWPGLIGAANGSSLAWELLIRTPEAVAEAAVAHARATLRGKGHDAAVDDVQLVTIHEGRCVQLLHVGPYDAEPQTVALMTAHAAKHDLVAAGAHHEIYLSDPRRVAAERLRTILRMPVRPVKS